MQTIFVLTVISEDFFFFMSEEKKEHLRQIKSQDNLIYKQLAGTKTCANLITNLQKTDKLPRVLNEDCVIKMNKMLHLLKATCKYTNNVIYQGRLYLVRLIAGLVCLSTDDCCYSGDEAMMRHRRNIREHGEHVLHIPNS